MKKRCVSVLLAVALLLSVSGAALGAFAADADNGQVTIQPEGGLAVTIGAGESKTVALELTGASEGGSVDSAAFQMHLHLPEGVTATKGVAQGFLTEMDYDTVNLAPNGKTDEVWVTCMNLDNVTVNEQNKRFAVITLSSEKGVTDALLTITHAKICRVTGEAPNVQVETVPGTITIVDQEPGGEPIPEPQFLLGDVNEDGDINGRDVVFLAQSIAGTRVLSDSQKINANVNGKDSEINGRDVVLLSQKIAGTVDSFDQWQ